MKSGTVYKIVKKDTKKPIYVGSTILKLNARFKLHLGCIGKSKSKLYTILNKTDYEIIEIEKLKYEKRKELYILEGIWMQKLDTIDNGCNIINPGNICGKKYFKERYENNKEEILKQGKIYRDNNKEKFKKKHKKYYDNNKEKILENVKLYRKNNPEKIKIRKNKSYHANKHKIKTIECECGGSYKDVGRARHFKRQIHIKYLKDLKNIL